MRLERLASIASLMTAMLADVAVATPREAKPLGLGLTETARVTLTVLDVEVTDRSGNPIHGLTQKDFAVRLDGRLWPIYSVDDLCDCATPSPPPAAEGSRRAGASAARLEPPSSVPTEPVRFILYFDFSQLQQGGRISAVREARRWIQVTMQPGDEVMLAAYATASGLRTLSGFTSDRTKLLDAIDGAFDDPTFMDPFPTQLLNRIEECRTAPLLCPSIAADEYHHGRRSLMALKRFLVGLDPVRGRKSLIFFHENGNIFPGAFYGVSTSDQARRLEEIGAEATSSHVAVFPATTGDEDLLGRELADYTGGRHNGGRAGLSGLIDDARSRCACIYRVALVPPDDRRRRIYPITIAVDGRVLPARYRVQSLTEMDRWMRSAQAVLVNPESAQDLLVTAGLIPVSADKGRWEMKAQVALNLGSLTMLPTAGGRSGMWEIGAALVRDDGKDSWEMLGLSEVHRRGDASGDTWVVHERRFHGLPKGRYHLAAFVRDRAANVFGGAEASLELPKPGTNGVAGPILMRPGLRQFVSPLPLLRTDETEPVQDTRVITDSLPAGAQQVEYPATLEAVTWICPRGEKARSTSPSRFISREGVPLLRFDAITPEPAGECLRIADWIERWRPEPGLHAYHVRWTSEDGSEVARAEVPFEVAGPPRMSRHVQPRPSPP